MTPLAALDILWAVHYPRMVAGDVKSATVCMRVLELRAKSRGVNPL